LGKVLKISDFAGIFLDFSLYLVKTKLDVPSWSTYHPTMPHFRPIFVPSLCTYLSKKGTTLMDVPYEQMTGHKKAQLKLLHLLYAYAIYGMLLLKSRFATVEWYFVTKIVLTYCEKKLF
jgi:hypothetical protein